MRVPHFPIVGPTLPFTICGPKIIGKLEIYKSISKNTMSSRTKWTEINNQMNARLERQKTCKNDSDLGSHTDGAFSYMQSFYTWAKAQSMGQATPLYPQNAKPAENSSEPLTREHAGDVQLSFKLNTKLMGEAEISQGVGGQHLASQA